MASRTKRNQDVIYNFYQQTLKKHPRGIKSYRWWYSREQESRFDELLKVVDGVYNFNHRSLLDVGCGRGDLYQHLIKKHHLRAKYTGIELMPEFVEAAKQQYPKVTFIEKDFLTWKTNRRYDYVVASGLLSVRIADNERYLRRTVCKMLRLARHGVAFNFLTASRKDKLRWWYYYNPGIILNWCISLKEATRIILTTGYDPFDRHGDATIILIKK